MNCLNPNCRSEAKARGLCLPCYNAARRVMLRMGITWDVFESSGKSLPLSPKNSWFKKHENSQEMHDEVPTATKEDVQLGVEVPHDLVL